MISQENLRMLWFPSNKRNTKNSLHLLVNLLPDGNLFIFFGNIFSYVFIYKTGVIVKDMTIFWVGPLQPPKMWNFSPAAALSTLQSLPSGDHDLQGRTKGTNTVVRRLPTRAAATSLTTRMSLGLWRICLGRSRAMGDGMLLPRGE